MTAILFTGSLMAETITINATDVTTIESGATTGLDVTLQGVRIVWEGAYYNNDQSQDIRVYANKTLSLTAESAITKVEIVGYGKKDLTVSSSAGSVVCADASAGEITKSDWEDPLIVVSDINAKSVTLTCTKQMRAYAVRLTLGEGGGEEPGDEPGDDPDPQPTVTGVVTFTNADFAGQGTPNTGSEVSATKDGVTFTYSKGYSADESLRCYAHGAMSIKAASTIAKINFTTTGGKDGGLAAEVAVNATSYEVADLASQARLTEIKVTLGEGGDEPGDEPGDDPQPVTDPTNCAEAAAAALSVADNNVEYNDGKEYTIQGYVTEIQTAFNAQYSNISFWMADTKDGGKVLEAYRAACASAEDAPAVGDKVAVTGKLTKYNTTPEFAAGCTVEILEKGEVIPVDPAKNLGEKTIAEFLELKNTKDTCVLTGIVANIKNATYGNFDLVELDNAEISVYVYGLLTAAGESKQFESLGVAEGDTLTVLAIYSEYNDAPQAKNAIFVSVKKAAVEPGEDVEITLNSLTNPGSLMWTDAVDVEGWWQIMGAGESYDFSISNVATEQTAGVYTVADLDPDYSYISIYGETDTVDVAFADGSVTVAVSEEGIVTVKGTLVGADGNNYIFDLTYKDPVAESTVDVAISEWTLIDDYVESYGLFVLAGNAEDETHVMLSLWMPEGATDIYGDYTEEDFDLQNFGCGIIDANRVAPAIFSADIKVESAENGDVLVTADLLCYNNTLYRVTTVNAGQGFENVDAAVKAVKSIVNGQLVIEKAGKRYNANGAVIR